MNRGEVEYEDSVDAMLEKSIKMLPSSFADLFSGELDPQTQRIVKVWPTILCVNIKLLRC